MPIQPVGDTTTEGQINLREGYADGLGDLDGVPHCILLYQFHRSGNAAPLEIEPFFDDKQRGVFATRAPQRPNPVGLAVVEIGSVTDSTVTSKGRTHSSVSSAETTVRPF
jgi:tRNA (Thr-GGU) A37 N-methylase